MNFSTTIRKPALLVAVIVCVDAEPADWDVEFLGGKDNPASTGDDWRFVARDRTTGNEKLFRSGTKLGRFVDVRSYESAVVVEANTGYGRGFTIYDLDSEGPVAEFYTLTAHWSPDGRYLIYRVFTSRNDPFRPEVKIVDLEQDLGKFRVENAPSRDGIGEVVFPPPPPHDRMWLRGAYGTTVSGLGFTHVAWDASGKFFYFVASDRTNLIHLVVLQLEPVPSVACYVPLTQRIVAGEYFHESKVFPTKLELRSPNIVVVTMVQNSFRVSSQHSIGLREACWEQNQAYAEGL